MENGGKNVKDIKNLKNVKARESARKNVKKDVGMDDVRVLFCFQRKAENGGVWCDVFLYG